jgi:uncharacterized protein
MPFDDFKHHNQQGWNMGYKYKILSIDGGGIRGIIPAKILAEVEKITGKRICQLFDLIAGTSTGGILALALAKPDPINKTQPQYTAQQLIDLYKNEGKTIFNESLLGRLTNIDDLIRPKFPSKGREAVLNKYFGETQIKEALTNVFVTSYDIEKRRQVFFINNPQFERPSGYNFRKLCDGYKMKDAAMATSAAPTFFSPYKLANKNPKDDESHYTLIDGGTFANNPTALAIIEALNYNKRDPHNIEKEPLRLDEILVVSLATGSLTRRYAYDKAANWGIINWVQPLINIVLDGATETVGYQLDQLLPQPKQYYRFQRDLTQVNDNIDDTTPENIKEIEDLAQAMIDSKVSHNETILQQMCQQLLH